MLNFVTNTFMLYIIGLPDSFICKLVIYANDIIVFNSIEPPKVSSHDHQQFCNVIWIYKPSPQDYHPLQLAKDARNIKRNTYLDMQAYFEDNLERITTVL